MGVCVCVSRVWQTWAWWCSGVWFGLRLWFLIWFWAGVVWGGCLMFWFVGLEFGLLVPVGLSDCCDLLVLV